LSIIEGKSDSNGKLKSASTAKNYESTQTTGINYPIDISNSFLYQNVPNPFSGKTEIKYFIIESVKEASLFIFDLQGIMKKQIIINERGSGSIILEGNELKAGMYIYTLICDNQEISSKRMILTE